MAKGWYVLHVYSGYENKIEKFIRIMMEKSPFTETVFDLKRELLQRSFFLVIFL
jgi:transcriptional antiterminator NusG